MSQFTKRKLSGSTDGKAVKVVATATPGTLLHTAVAGTTAGTFDEVWLWAWNGDTAARLLTIEFGGVTDPDNIVEVVVQPQAGWQLVVPGHILQNALVVRAFAAAASVVVCQGHVNAITD